MTTDVAGTAPAHTGTAPALTPDQLAEVLTLLPGSDSVELKVTVPESDRRSVVERLGMDVMQAELRQVAFVDTPDLALDEHGVVLRARRIQRKAGDSVVKLRPVVPSDLGDGLRRMPGFGVEVDALPGGFVCSARLKEEVADPLVHQVFRGEKPVSQLFTKHQRSLFEAHAPDGVGFDDLRVLGPFNILKLKFAPEGFSRRMVAEVWFYPDGSRILELSTKCAPSDAFAVTAEAKAFLASHGVDLGAPQQTKTRTALSYYVPTEGGTQPGDPPRHVQPPSHTRKGLR